MRRLHRKSSAADTYLRPTSGAGVETLVGGMTDFRQVFRNKLARQLVSGSNSYKTERVHVPCARTQTESQCSTERTKARTEQNSSLPTPLENCMQPREIDIKFTPLRARVNKSSEFSMDQCTPSYDYSAGATARRSLEILVTAPNVMAALRRVCDLA